jgi:catechol 2,3-dioxygenase-like lactoylglutathione lyase family enzyme
MLGKHDVIAFVATKLPEQAKAFYSSVLGLRLVSDTPFALVYDAGGTMLRISKVAELTPAPHTVLGWKVPDIRAIMQDLANRGITFQRYKGLPQDELGIWTTPDGHRISWFKDPDGNTLSLTQFYSA